MLDLKNTTDDALPNYLNSLRFRQSHLYTDVRHLLGFTAVAIAAATFYFDYTLGWEKTKTGTLWAVIAYFILNGALTLWLWRVERGCVYVGELKDVKVGVVHAPFLPPRISSAPFSSSISSRVADLLLATHSIPGGKAQPDVLPLRSLLHIQSPRRMAYHEHPIFFYQMV